MVALKNGPYGVGDTIDAMGFGEVAYFASQVDGLGFVALISRPVVVEADPRSITWALVVKVRNLSFYWTLILLAHLLGI